MDTASTGKASERKADHRFVALLRGINVGGNNKVSMPELRSLLTEKGYRDVSTYINSGNVFFSVRKTDILGIQTDLEKRIAERFGCEIRIAVYAAEELSDMLAHAPEWWGSDPESKHNAIFVIPPSKAADVIKEVGRAKPEYERVAYRENLIYWSAPIATFSKTRWLRIVGTAAYDMITIRNANTLRELARLSAGA
jgi:uncharacterized protein (DUF1697 family)